MLANAKGILVTALSVLLFHDPMPWRNCASYAIVVAGAVSYSVSKARSPVARSQWRAWLVHPGVPSSLWGTPIAAHEPLGDVLANVSDGAACLGGLGDWFPCSRRWCSGRDRTGSSSRSSLPDEQHQLIGDCVVGWGEESPGRSAGHREVEVTISANDVDAPLLPVHAGGDRSPA